MENKRRLIDADLMALEESEAYMKVQTSGSVSPVTYGINSVVHRKIQELIASAPTVDAVEVVRCKDCDWYREDGSICVNAHCSKSYYGCRVRQDQFCSYGERKDND